MFRSLLTLAVLFAASVVTVVADPPLPRNVKTCWEVKCVGQTGICIILGEGNGPDGPTSFIRGKADIKKVPCNSTVLPGAKYGTAAFVADPHDPSVGMGWTAADAYVTDTQGSIVEYDDSRTYSTYEEWNANR